MVMIILALFLLFSSDCFAKSLVCVLWDGAGSNNVTTMMDEGKLPNLKSIVDRGVYIPIEPMGKTKTIPEWTVRFTGMTYDQTKVLSNKKWEIVPYTKTIISKIQNKGNKVGWFVSKPYLSVEFPLQNIFLHADKKKELSPIYRDAFTGEFINFGEITRKWYMEVLVQDALDALPELGNDFILIIHVNPDIWGHKYGENSIEYLKEIERADKNLGIILQALPSETSIMVMNDHGFDEGKKVHNNAPDCWLATDIPLTRKRGTSRDIALTILDYFEVEWRNDPVTYRGSSLR